jgi:asparagine synthase (glutamine-hydrolysing)
VTRLGFAVDWENRGRAAGTAGRLVSGEGAGAGRVTTLGQGAAALAVAGSPEGDVVEIATAGLVVAFDGRLDNLRDLRRNLDLDPGTPVARTLGAAYLKQGDPFVAQLRGDYALVVWDGLRRRLLAARDPFGVRPLHYASVDGQLVVASDADQFLLSGVARPVPDQQSVAEFLSRDLRSLDRSFFRDVSRVPPGHLLVGTDLQVRTADYRRMPGAALSFSSPAEAQEAFREKFLAAVARRLDSENAVLIQLSGGVDSTSIVCAANVLLGTGSAGGARAFAASATFPGLDCDESRFLEAVERHVSIPVVRWDGTQTSGVELQAPLLAAPGTRIPWASGTDGFVEIAMARQARTILDGTGGDQVGLPLGTESEEVVPGDLGWIGARFLESRPSLAGGLRLLRWAIAAGAPRPIRDLRSRYRRASSPSRPEWLLVAPAVPRQPPPSVSSGYLSSAQMKRWETLAGAPLAASIDAKQRHASWFGLDTAFPFLDWDLVQFTLALPPRYWRPRGWLARIQREALRRDLPPEVYRRRSKAEFTSAMINRVRGNLEVISDLFAGETWAAAEIIEKTKARRLLEDFRRDPAPGFAAAYYLWAVASVEAWLRRVLGYRIDTA